MANTIGAFFLLGALLLFVLVTAATSNLSSLSGSASMTNVTPQVLGAGALVVVAGFYFVRRKR